MSSQDRFIVITNTATTFGSLIEINNIKGLKATVYHHIASFDQLSDAESEYNSIKDKYTDSICVVDIHEDIIVIGNIDESNEYSPWDDKDGNHIKKNDRVTYQGNTLKEISSDDTLVATGGILYGERLECKSLSNRDNYYFIRGKELKLSKES